MDTETKPPRLTEAQRAEIEDAAKDRSPYTESGIHVNYGNAEDLWIEEAQDELENGSWERVPPGKVIADAADVLTAEQKASALTAAKEIRRLYNEHGGGDIVSYEAWKASWLLAKMGGEDW